MGQDEVVGVGDTGVDIDSCYFLERSKALSSTEALVGRLVRLYFGNYFGKFVLEIGN